MIDKFEGEYRWLSNFYTPVSITDDMGLVYSSTEAAYQAAKTLKKEERIPFTEMTPGQSKKAGKKLVLREDWEEIKAYVMWDLLKQKFNDPVLRQKLLDTGDQELIEGNWWGDCIWGVCNGVGKNWLGKMLVELRKRLAEGK